MELDLGGLSSLVFTIVAVIILLYIKGKRPKDIETFYKKLDVPSALAVTILMGVGTIAIWLSVRIVGLYVFRYLFERNYGYSQYQIFNIVAYILTANLCYTLLESLRGKRKMKQILNATMQAVLIGVITFLPQHGNENFLRKVGGVSGFVLILFGMAVMLFSIMFVGERIKD